MAHRVLIVDDEPLLGKALSRLLRGYDVDVVEDGVAALEKCRQCTYDLIFCDVSMGRMSGPEFHAALSEEQPAQIDKIVFMTGDTVSPPFVRFLQATTNEAIEKPFDVDEVRRVLMQRLG